MDVCSKLEPAKETHNGISEHSVNLTVLFGARIGVRSEFLQMV